MESQDFSNIFGSSRSFEDQLQDPTNPLVYCLLTLDGKKFLAKNSYTVELHQKTADHDTFNIIVPDDSLDSFEGYVMENSKNLLGKDITITYSRFGKVRQTFRGIIGKIKNKKDEGGGYGDLHITGYAPSILLESGKDCQSFEDKTLEQIVKLVTEEYPQEAKVEISSNYLNEYNKRALPYTVQFKESDYQFIKRLAIRHGEFFYYNGEKLIFGNSVQPILKLGQGIDLMDIDFEMQIGAQDFLYQSYDVQSGFTIEKDSNSIQSEFKESLFQSIAVNTSKKIFRQKPKMQFNYTGIQDRSQQHLAEIVRLEKERRENLVQTRGKSKDPELRIGGRAQLSDINGKAMETYRIIEIKHIFEPGDYYNEFVGIPDFFNASPYIDTEAVPKGEEQPARVMDNNDPMGMGRVRVQFPWQEDKNQTTPWIRLIQPHSGSGKGFHFIPEIGEEVLVCHESQNAEKPFVMGTHYNGGETSGFHTAGNDLKVTKTRSGHTIIMDDSKDKMSITIIDISGNTIYMDTVKKSITITAPETIDIICKNLNIKVEENMKTTVGHNQENTIGKNIKTVAKEEISQDSGKKTIISSGDNTEISAKKDLDLYGKKNLIGFTDGKTEFGAKEQMHVYGMTSLITAKDKIEYKAPSMNKIPENGKFDYTKAPSIIDFSWMDEDMENQITETFENGEVKFHLQTRNMEVGEIVEVTVTEIDGLDVNEGEKEVTLSGTVDENGMVELKEVFKIQECEKQDLAEDEISEPEDKNAIYRTYEGKDYTKAEWKKFDDEQYKIYLEKRSKKGFWG